MLLDNVLIIFVKYPEPGFVKTRLAEGVGKEKAVELYRLFAESVLKRTNDRSYRRFIFYSPKGKRDEIIDWIGGELEYYPQEGDNLGQRMENAFRSVFKKGTKRIVIIGTDSPLIDKEIILKAFSRLEETQCVIGPSHDGGYYLLGLSTFCKEIFKGIDWSTNRVFKQTLDKLNRAGLSFSLLDKHFDIDTIEDLKYVFKTNPDYS